jgi:DNA-binding TFAR19-related protein (PDSD5 family)
MKRKPKAQKTQKPRFTPGANPPQRLSPEAKKRLANLRPAKKTIEEAATVTKFIVTT